MLHYGRAPGWVDGRGYPSSWKRYVLGMRHLERHHARCGVRNHDAFFIAGARKEDRVSWLRVMNNKAAWD